MEIRRSGCVGLLLRQLCISIAAVQMLLFPWNPLDEREKRRVYSEIRNAYWFIRAARPGGEARRLKYYRLVADNKKRLLLAGVQKREILEFLSCCRGKCKTIPCVHF